MKMINEITKFLSDLTYQEKKLPTNLTNCIDEGVLDYNLTVGIEIVVTKDSHYFVLECDTVEVGAWTGQGDIQDWNGSNAELLSIDYAYKYNYDGERIESHELNEKQSEEVLNLLPSLSDIN